MNTVNEFLVTDKLSNGLKFAGLAIGATSATFSLFVAMSKLVDNQTSYQTTVDAPMVVELSTAKEDSDTNKIVKTLPKPPAKQEMPRPTSQAQTPDTGGGLQIFGGEFEMHTPDIKSGYVATGNKNFGAMPIVRVPPSYPKKAAIEGIEGWVNLSFTINKLGKVVDVRVVDAEPKRIFDKEARKALRKWKYKPKMVNGEAVIQEGQYVVLEFKMDNG